MDEDGKRMIRVGTTDTIEAVTIDTHEIWAYEPGTKGFVCNPSPLRGEKGINLLRMGDRVRITGLAQRETCTDAIGKTGTVSVYGLRGDEARVDLDEPLGCRRSVRASAVDLLNRLPWD